MYSIAAPRASHAQAGLWPTLLLFAAFVSLLCSPAQAQVSATDGLVLPINGGELNKVIVDDNGKLVVVGSFTRPGFSDTLRVMRVRSRGAADNTLSVLGFQPASGTALGVAAIPNAGYLVGGDFLGGGHPGRMVELQANGSVVGSFNLNLDGTVHVIERRRLGITAATYYVGGDFSEAQGAPRNRLLRLTTARNLDSGFVPPAFSGSVRAIKPLPDGKVLVAGNALFIPGNNAAGTAIFRLNSDGSLDNSFVFDSLQLAGQILAVDVQSDGRIMIAGNFAAVSGDEGRTRIARLNQDGSLDLSFQTQEVVNGSIYDLAVQPDDRIVVVGDFTNVNILGTHIGRLFPDGAPDDDFSLFVQPNDPPRSIAIQGDGSTTIVGAFDEVSAGVSASRGFRIMRTLGLDRAFSAGSALGSVDGSVIASAVTRDGSVIIGGDFATVQGAPRLRLARLSGLNGQVQSANPSFNNTVHTLLVLPDERILVGGEFTQIDGTTRPRIARLNPDLTLDLSFFAPISMGTVLALEVAPDGKIYVGGDFNVAGNPALGIPALGRFVRLLPDGTLDPDFPDMEVDGTVRAITRHWDEDRIFLAGDFTSVRGVTRNRVARIGPLGGISGSFVPVNIPSGIVYSMSAMSDGGVMVAGSFGSPRQRIARLNADGSLNNVFDAGSIDDSVLSFVVDHLDRVYIGGTFTSVGGTPRQGLARLQPSGSLDTIALPAVNHDTSPGIFAMNVLSDGKLLVNGVFDRLSAVFRSNVGKLSVGEVVGETIVRQESGSIFWLRGGTLLGFDAVGAGGGPVPRAAPELMVSDECCDNSSFSVIGTMSYNSTGGGYWFINDVDVPVEGLYVKVRARTGDSRGGSMFETPIHRLRGDDDRIFTNGFEATH